MTFDRAIEILDPEHREHYESLDPVNEACRMGMNALVFQRDFVFCRQCESCNVLNDRHSFECRCHDMVFYSPEYDADTYFCGSGKRRR